MKTFSTIVMLLLISFSLKAQQTNLPYHTQPDLKRFTGEWQYVTHDTTFIIDIKLVKTFVKIGTGIYLDLIYGDYIIKKDGQILQSSSNRQGIRSGGYVDKDISKDKISFLFTDFGRKSKSGDVVFELLNANKASWKLTNTEGVRIGYYDYSFSVPEKAVFERFK